MHDALSLLFGRAIHFLQLGQDLVTSTSTNTSASRCRTLTGTGTGTATGTASVHDDIGNGTSTSTGRCRGTGTGTGTSSSTGAGGSCGGAPVPQDVAPRQLHLCRCAVVLVCQYGTLFRLGSYTEELWCAVHALAWFQRPLRFRQGFPHLAFAAQHHVTSIVRHETTRDTPFLLREAHTQPMR